LPLVLSQNAAGRLDQRASEAVPNLGKVFVMFDSAESAKKAMSNIAGRQFGGRTVVCAYAGAFCVRACCFAHFDADEAAIIAS
jgi:hypothetical protein